MSNYETSDCPLCGHSEARASRHHQDDFRIVSCLACKLWYLSPRLTQAAMQEHYARADYFEGGDSGYDSYASQEMSLRLTFRQLLTNLQKRGICGGSVLDVGCGYGYFLDEANSFFEFRAGTDYSDGALDRAKKSADQVFQGGVDSVPQDLMFDCIVALHVVEHVYEPRGFVDSLYERLKPGGTLVLAAPDKGSWWRPVMGSRWPSYKYPEHVVYYDKRSLTRLMTTVNLVEHQSIPYPHAFPMNLVLKKLGLPAFSAVADRALWMPATTVAIAAKKPVTQSRRAAA